MISDHGGIILYETGATLILCELLPSILQNIYYSSLRYMTNILCDNTVYYLITAEKCSFGTQVSKDPIGCGPLGTWFTLGTCTSKNR